MKIEVHDEAKLLQIIKIPRQMVPSPRSYELYQGYDLGELQIYHKNGSLSCGIDSDMYRRIRPCFTILED